jgi:hypothetical protein
VEKKGEAIVNTGKKAALEFLVKNCEKVIKALLNDKNELAIVPGSRFSEYEMKDKGEIIFVYYFIFINFQGSTYKSH